MKKILKNVKELFDFQLIRFMMIGAVNTLVSYIAYLLVFYLTSGNYIIANIAGFIAGTVNAYFGNSKFVFKQKKFELIHALKTFLSYGATCAVNTGLLYVIVNFAKISAVVAPVLNSVLIFVLNFVLNKFWVYKKREDKLN